MIEDIIKDNNFSTFFERSTLITHLKHIKTGQELIDFYIHAYIPAALRLKTSKLLNEFACQELIANPNAKIIILGTFNSFVDKQGHEQINILKNAAIDDQIVLIEVSDTLYLPSGKAMPDNSTFIFFPFDHGANDNKFKK